MKIRHPKKQSAGGLTHNNGEGPEWLESAWPDHHLTLGDSSDRCPSSSQTKGRVSVSVFFSFQKESGTDYMLWSSTGVLCTLLSVSRPQVSPSAETQQPRWWDCPVGLSTSLPCPNPYQNTNQLWKWFVNSRKWKKNKKHMPADCQCNPGLKSMPSHGRILLKSALQAPVRTNWQVNVLKIKGDRTMSACLPRQKKFHWVLKLLLAVYVNTRAFPFFL